MSDDFGPRWCLNSEEVGVGMMLYIAIGIIFFSVLPVLFLGYWLASKIWDVKIFKYPIALMAACGYGMGLIYLYACFPKALTFGVIGLGWLMLDYISAHRNIKQMWLIRSIRKSTKWLFSK